MSICGNMVGSYSQIGKTFIIKDENGNELIGVVTDTQQIFDATAEDVKIGKTFASDSGIETGTDTKTYRTVHGSRLVFPEETFIIPIEEYDGYDYTKFQAMISVFNTSELDSVAVNKVSLYDAVYDANSTNKIADVTKNAELKSIDLNFINNTDNVYVINYNTYKEE